MAIAETKTLQAKIQCPSCGSFDSGVIDTRGSNNAIRRRRRCVKCSWRFSTFETLEGTFDSGTQADIKIVLRLIEKLQNRLELLLATGSDE